MRAYHALGLCLLLAAGPLLAAAACDGTEVPNLMLTGTSDAATCLQDPVVQCLSEIVLETDTSCGVKPTVWLDSAQTVRIKTAFSTLAIDRNVMSTPMALPWIGDDVYTTCDALLTELSSVFTGTGTAAANFALLLNTLDPDAQWSVAADANGYTATNAGTTCTYSWTVVDSSFDGVAAPTGSSLVTLFTTPANMDGMKAVLKPGSSNYIAVYCPSGYYAARTQAGGDDADPITIQTDCDPIMGGETGYYSNQVGAKLKTGKLVGAATRCPAGTYAGIAAAQCLPCDVNTYSPLDGMSACIECSDSYAPIQGSTRCFAGFGGQVYVTEGRCSVSTGSCNTIYDPNDGIKSVLGETYVADGHPLGGYTVVETENTDDNVANLGGPNPGWAIATMAYTAPTGGASNIPFLSVCAGATNTLASYVTGEGTAMLSYLGNNQCGQVNRYTDDISPADLPADFTVEAAGPPVSVANMRNLTLTYASPTELVAFWEEDDVDGTALTVIVYITATSASAASITVYEQAATLATLSVAASSAQPLVVVTNNVGADVTAMAATCLAGTSYFEKADSTGLTYAKMCRPCPDGYYCAKPRANFSPVPTPCPLGTRGSVFGQTALSQCVDCNIGYYQDTTGEMICMACAQALKVKTTSCASSCPDGWYSTDPQSAACTVCAAGDWRSGDMGGVATCTTCPAGSEVLRWYESAAAITAVPLDNIAAAPAQADFTDAGYYPVPFTVTGGEGCKPCEPGNYNNQDGVCRECDAGLYSPRAGLSACINCPIGTYSTGTGNQKCTQAKKGYYVTTTGRDTVPTDTCRRGYYGVVAGGRSHDQACRKCAPGSFSTIVAATNCTSCQTGYYQPNAGQTGCLACPAGTISLSQGAQSCTICAAGFYSRQASTQCAKCPVGTYQDKAKSSGCKACPAGYYCPVSGMTTKTACPAGTYNPRTNGATKALSCLPCKDSTKVAATSCTYRAPLTTAPKP